MTRKKAGSKVRTDDPSSGSGSANSSLHIGASGGGGGGGVGDDQEHLITDEYIVPQVVKVVSLADTEHCFFINGNGNGEKIGGVTSGNNIVLTSGDSSEYDEHGPPPPSFIDNVGEQAECILGLPLDYEGDDEEEESLNHKYASFTLSTPCQPDERVDYFSPSSSSSTTTTIHSNTSYHTFQLGSSSLIKHGASDTSKSTEASQPEDDDDDDDNNVPCGVVQCSSVWEEMHHCQFHHCSVPANKRCKQCKSAFYCGEEHHRRDWSRHKHVCTPFRIQFIGMDAAAQSPTSAPVANRDIPEGQLIFAEKPMLVFPLADSQGETQLRGMMELPCVLAKIRGETDIANTCDADRSTCFGCSAKTLRRPSSNSYINDRFGYKCTKCGLVLCSYNCCTHSAAHSVGECEAIRSIAGQRISEETSQQCCHTLYMDIEILRAMQLEKYDRNGWEQLLNMKSTVRVEAYKNSVGFSRFRRNFQILVPLSAKISGYNGDLIADIHAIISSLSYRPNLNCPYKLLFNTQAQFAHDCVPNTLQYVEREHDGDGARMRLITKAAISIMKGTVITVDFTPSPYLPYPKRREVLSEVLCINNCQCQRCQHPSVMNDLTAEIKCNMCKQGSVWAEVAAAWSNSVWACRICNEEMPFSKVQEIEQKSANELMEILSSGKSNVVNDLLEFIQRAGNFDLNPKHHLIFTAWCYIESLLRNKTMRFRSCDPAKVYHADEMECFDILGKYADTMLEHMNSVRQGLWVDKAIAKFHKFYSMFAKFCYAYQKGSMSKKEFTHSLMKAFKILQEALQTLSVYEGYNAPSVVYLTQEATGILSSLKEYLNYFLQLNDQDSYPLPPLAQAVSRS